MKKKEYKVPTLRVVNLDCRDIICTSGGGNGLENLSRDPFGGETLGQDDDGYVWGD